MATSRVFCYNPVPIDIPNTESIGSMSVATGTINAVFYTNVNLQWWNGPDEDLGYIIAYVDSSGDRPNAPERTFLTNYVCNIGFFRSAAKTDQSFVDLAKLVTGSYSLSSATQSKEWLNNNGYWTSWTQSYIAGLYKTTYSGYFADNVSFFRSAAKTDQSFVDLVKIISASSSLILASQSKTWLNNNGYWTSYSPIITSGLILNYDLSNSSSYSGSGTTITDLQGNSNATLTGSPAYSPSNGGYLTFVGSSNQYLLLDTNLNSKLSPVNTSNIISYFVWIYLTGNGVIVDETSTVGWHDSQIELVSGTLRFSVWSNGTGFASTVVTPLNAWYYVGLTYDNTTLRAYVNGSAAGSAAYTRTTPYNGSGQALRYAIALTDGTNLGDGGYGDFRWGAFQVYNTALSAGDVLSNYNATKSRFGL